MQVPIFRDASVVNIFRKHGDITPPSLGGKIHIFHAFNLEDTNAIGCRLGLVRKVANRFANEFRGDFSGWGVVVQSHVVHWLRGKSSGFFGVSQLIIPFRSKFFEE